VVAASDPRYWPFQLAVISIGLALRLHQYFRNDSLWGDEAMLALSIASRPFEELLRPLAYGQVAPVPFLWAERLMVLLFGVHEWALRAVPFIAGSALCVAIVLVARRMLRPNEAFVALVLVALSQILVRYSAEVKSYSLDAFLAVAVVGAAAALMARMDSWKSWVLLGVLGSVAVLSAFTSVFVCLGVAVALAVRGFVDKRAELFPRIGLLGLLWATLFAVTFSFYRPAGSGSYMRSFWEGAFLVPGSAHLLRRTQAAALEVSRAIDPGMAVLGLSALTLSLVLVGAVTLCRRRQVPHALLLLVPGLAPFAASALGIYPIATRLMLFAAPLFIMLTAVGIMIAAKALHGLIRPVPIRWVAAILLLPAVTTSVASVLYERDQQMRPLVHELNGRWRPGDAVYVFHREVPAWLFYSTDWATPNIGQLAWAMRVSGPGGLGHENGPTRGPRPPREGDDLVYNLAGHPVLLGTSSGVQGRPMFGYSPRQPDPGWAANEGKRIRDAASSRIWVIVGNASHQGIDLGEILLDAVKQEGGRLTFQESLQDGRLYRFQLPPAREK
jgi:4-amino-4-deoxy-L-arabinose transferase-like glycosyltransferase